MGVAMKGVKRFSLLILFVSLSILLMSCIGENMLDISEVSLKTVQRNYLTVDFKETDKYIYIENEILNIEMDKNNCAFLLTDKRNGNTIHSIVDPDLIDDIRTSNLQKQLMSSMFTVYYANKDSVFLRNIRTTTFATEGEDANAIYEQIENGLKIDVEFQNLGLGFSVLLRLKDDMLNVEIPGASIVEQSNFGIISIDFLPFFNFALEEDQGYFVYLDGSGALYSFEDAKTLPRSALRRYVFPIYSDDLNYLEEDNLTWYVDGDISKPVSLPVFGINKIDTGVLAIIEKGDYDSSVILTPAGSILPINQIHPNFIYRRLFSIRRSKTNVQGVGQQENTIRRMEQTPIATDRSVTYKILNENNCDYSGMAREYRNILINEKIIPERLQNNKTPFIADIFMGVLEKRFPFDQYRLMTSFDQANSIYNELKNNNIENIHINLLGWSKNGFGIYPQQYKIDRRLGNSKDYFSLIDNITNNGDKLFFQINTIDIRNNLGGINIRNVAVTMGNGIILTNDESDRYIYSPRESAKIFRNKVETLPDSIGITFDRIGNFVYNDYNRNNFTKKEDTSLIWESKFDYTKKTERSVGIIGSNIYTFKYADMIFGVPDSDTGYLISSQTIPFLQMVLKGSVVYTGIPINLSGDISMLRLKMIEYGYVPYFLFTHQKSEELMYTNYNNLYSTEFEKWVDLAAEIYNDFSYNLDAVKSQSMVSHEIIDIGIVSVEYENGHKVIVNYNDYDYSYKGHTIKGNSYFLVEEVKD